jgi:hypothetical protein
MSLDLTVKNLLSRKIRVNSAAGKSGLQLFDTITSTLADPRKIDGLTRLKAEGEGVCCKTFGTLPPSLWGFWVAC